MSNLGKLFGIHSYASSEIVHSLSFYSDAKVMVLLIIGIIGATILGDSRIIKLYNRIKEEIVFMVFQELFLVLLFIISISFMISTTFQPFIYFQF